jgi:drug/metabolite transporter (DMT)-like permease
VSDKKHNILLALGLLFAVFLWGGNNCGTRFIVGIWPPVWTGSSRFFCAGLLLLGVLRWTSWLGRCAPLSPELKRQLWWRGGANLAAYIVAFNTALHFTAASHVALYLGASPVWALLWEGCPDWNRTTFRRYGAAALALTGVLVLFWPAVRGRGGDWRGEALGVLASVIWTHYGRQCRILGQQLSGAETSAHTMWRAGLCLAPLALGEVFARGGITWRADILWVQTYCIIAGGVVAFAIWNQALRQWPTSRVLLFNNLIPVSTMGWAFVCLREPVSSSFWGAMALVLAGVWLGQTGGGSLAIKTNAPPERGRRVESSGCAFK